MSDAQREQTDALLGTVDRVLREALATRPNMDPQKVDALFETALLDANRAREQGLIDDVCYEDELPAKLVGDGLIQRIVRAPRYYAWRSARLLVPLLPTRFIAVIPVHGSINSGQPSSPGGMKLASTITTLRAARRDPRVAGVVLHVDSPGGSATASDLIHREVERLRELKPVVACFGDVAASGGYYVAAAAHSVVAQPLTVTGSIGVVSARVVTEPLLEKLGVHVETISRAPHADMLQRTGQLGIEESAILDREIDSFYQAFVGIVARGRGKAAEEIEPLARGRVWSGQDAHTRGLVDTLGGLDVALEDVRQRLGKMPERARKLLRPRLMMLRRLELPPAEPPRKEAAVAMVLGALHPRLAELWELASSGDRVLAYAADLPNLR